MFTVRNTKKLNDTAIRKKEAELVFQNEPPFEI